MLKILVDIITYGFALKMVRQNRCIVGHSILSSVLCCILNILTNVVDNAEN